MSKTKKQNLVDVSVTALPPSDRDLLDALCEAYREIKNSIKDLTKQGEEVRGDILPYARQLFSSHRSATGIVASGWQLLKITKTTREVKVDKLLEHGVSPAKIVRACDEVPYANRARLLASGVSMSVIEACTDTESKVEYHVKDRTDG